MGGTYVTESFIKKCNNKKKIKNGNGVHGRTADNVNAYFNGKRWVWTSKEDNPRLNKSKKSSIKYLERAMKCFGDTKTKYSKNKKSKYYKKLKL